MHALNKGAWDNMVKLGVVKRLEEIKQEGKIKYFGFSFHDDYPAFEEILTGRDWDFCQIQLNYMDTETQAGMKGVALAKEKGTPLIIMEPVKGGSLAAFSGDIMEKLCSGSDKKDVSAASTALRWVGSQPNVKVILSGMSTMEQVEDNLRTFNSFTPLTAREQAAIDEVVKALRGRIKNGCTSCRYCMPCPAGVDIAGCFRVWNTYHMYQNYNSVKWGWENEMGDKAQAKNCIKCGECEEKCPQKVRIRDDLEKVCADMDSKIY
jgi:predicted aldo/keto reductase-like oxidoreductase